MAILLDILRSTDYSLDQFSDVDVLDLEQRIFIKNVRGKDQFFVTCLIRNKDIQLKPEEIVRQLYIKQLLDQYGYPSDRIRVEYVVNFGRQKKRADIVVMDSKKSTAPYIIIEVKKPKLKDGKEQLKSYCNATGAPLGVWTNGGSISFYNRKDPNYFEDIPSLPKSTQSLAEILTERWSIADLILKDKLLTERKSLKDLILEMEDEVLANAGVDVFEEVFKLIFTKLYDEMESGRNNSRNLEFRNYGYSDTELKGKIQDLFDKAKKKWEGVFSDDTKIGLTPSHLSICVSSLQDVKLFNSNLDVVDDAFEYLMNKSQKGEKGQYFTPRYVIDMCVKMLNPNQEENMIDTAAGSCGFPVHTIFYVWEKILRQKGLERSHLFTSEIKPAECTDYVNEHVFAIDFDEKAVRVARTLNLIAGDGQTNVLHLNTLDYDNWDENEEDEDWRDTYYTGWKRLKRLRKVRGSNRDFNFDVLMANPPFAGDIKESRLISKYELGTKSNGKAESKVSRDILFIERNLDFLKPGGRMAVVLPQGRFNNATDKRIRDYIAERCRILAVVGLHGNVFKPHTGTKTSVLFVQKWDEKLCPRVSDYPIFFATMKKPSKDNSGDKIYLRNDDGTAFLDEHSHLIVDHDLFNHEGLTSDGIAEAFIEFAKKEKLSFFLDSPFNENKYNGLLKGLEISEIPFSTIRDRNRFDAEYFMKKYLKIEKKLDSLQTKSLESISHFVIGPFGSAYNTENYLEHSNYRYIRGQDVKPIILEDNSNRYISKQDYDRLKKYSLEEKDLLVSVVGTLGNVALVQKQDLPAIFSNKSTALRIFNGDPIFLMVYMNTKYGKMDLLRNTRGTVQTGLNLEDLKKVRIPWFSNNFQMKVKELVIEALRVLSLSKSMYLKAENSLLELIEMDKVFEVSEVNRECNIKKFSESFEETGRLDAEYYQKKYEILIENIKGVKHRKLKKIVGITKSIEPGSLEYLPQGIPFIRVANLSKFGIGKTNIFLSKKKFGIKGLMPKRGTILFSKDGSVGVAYHLRKDGDFITSGAILHLTTDASIQQLASVKVLPEYLTLVLNSPIVQLQAERDAGGSIIQHWRVGQIENTLIPIADMDFQNMIKEQIDTSFTLRELSNKILRDVKNIVELAIESGEKNTIGSLDELFDKYHTENSIF